MKSKISLLFLAILLSSTQVLVAKDLSALWEENATFLNSFSERADDHHFFLFDFSNKGVAELERQEQREVVLACGEHIKMENHFSVRELSKEKFVIEEVEEIYSGILLAINYYMDEQTRDETFNLSKAINRLSSLITAVALESTGPITKISSSGDCQGAWLNTNWVIQTKNGTYSISLGGGE